MIYLPPRTGCYRRVPVSLGRRGRREISGAIYERIRCGISFDKVTGVRFQNLNQSQRGKCSIYWRSKHRESM